MEKGHDGEEPVVLDDYGVFCNISAVVCSTCEKHPVTSAQFILSPEAVDKYLWEDTPEGRVMSSERAVIGKLRRGEGRTHPASLSMCLTVAPLKCPTPHPHSHPL